MGYKIWRKDRDGWSIAFDSVYPTKERVEERIAELNARYHNLVKFGELSFYAYTEDVKLDSRGNIVNDQPYKKRRNNRNEFEYKRSLRRGG